MHPEILSDVPGACPKCGMALVLKKEGEKTVAVIGPEHDTGLGKLTFKSYLPLIVVIVMIALVTATLTLRDTSLEVFSFKKTISYFMTGFFLVFGMFKLMDLNGFKEGYSTYDLLAVRIPAYGYVYPFLEIFFGLAMVLAPFSRGLLWVELLVMVFSGLGVAIKIAKKEPFMCACLGTFLRVPLTKITLIEDFGMAVLAGIMLLF